MVRAAHLGGILGAMVAGFALWGCAQNDGETDRSAAPGAQGSEAQAVDAPAELGPYRPISSGAIELRPVTTWERSEKDGFEILAAPGGRARILMAPLQDGDDTAARRDAALALLGATDVRAAEERAIRVGEGQLEAKANDGSCRLPSGDAGFQYAVIDAGPGRKAFMLYVFDKGIPEATREAGMRVIASIRGKS